MADKIKMKDRVGTVIDGKYEVLKKIGEGGMSIVYLAMDKRLNKQWAIKEIKPKNEQVKRTSKAEADLMKRLDHPALPRIVDIIDEPEGIFVIMDYVEGDSLDKVLKREGPLPEEDVLNWAIQICDVLNYLHSQNPPIIYRDMKPANVMLKPEGNIKVLDFGVAREYKEQKTTDTTIFVSKGYAPPEQYGGTGQQTDARSDIFALGMTMHHLLTGKSPLEYDYAPVRQWNPELSEGVEELINKCVQFDPINRYQNCDELMYDLQHPDQIGQGIRRKKKRRLAAFLITAVFSLLMLGTGVAGQLLYARENDRNYEQMIAISSSTPYETRVATYIEAIDLYPADVRGYEVLLSAYQENGRFGDEESNQFTAKYNQNQSLFDTGTDEYLGMLYEAGITYFNLYSGGDNTFRTRVLKAYPYFETIVNTGREDYSYYGMAKSYQIVGNFYSQYVVNATSVKEPTKETYDELLASMQVCLDSMDTYDYDDASYIKLTMYQEVMNLLYDHRKSFATTQVAKEDVLQLMGQIRDKAEALSVTQQVSMDIQSDILDSYADYVENIERSYTNTEERS